LRSITTKMCMQLLRTRAYLLSLRLWVNLLCRVPLYQLNHPNVFISYSCLIFIYFGCLVFFLFANLLRDTVVPIRGSIILSCLIQERARSVVHTAGCSFSGVSGAALLVCSFFSDPGLTVTHQTFLLYVHSFPWSLTVGLLSLNPSTRPREASRRPGSPSAPPHHSPCSHGDVICRSSAI
jgi:hypothetical protein